MFMFLSCMPLCIKAYAKLINAILIFFLYEDGPHPLSFYEREQLRHSAKHLLHFTEETHKGVE